VGLALFAAAGFVRHEQHTARVSAALADAEHLLEAYEDLPRTVSVELGVPSKRLALQHTEEELGQTAAKLRVLKVSHEQSRDYFDRQRIAEEHSEASARGRELLEKREASLTSLREARAILMARLVAGDERTRLQAVVDWLDAADLSPADRLTAQELATRFEESHASMTKAVLAVDLRKALAKVGS
jgi:hypothetical protein